MLKSLLEISKCTTNLLLKVLLYTGIPEDKANAIANSKPKLDVKVEGDKITVDVDGLQKQTNVYVLNQEVDEVLQGTTLKVSIYHRCAVQYF